MQLELQEKKDIKKAEKERHEKKEERAEANLQNEKKRAHDDKNTGDKPDLIKDKEAIKQDEHKVKELKKQE